MIALHFQAKRLPRTMTRAEWREADRWRRVTQRMVDEMFERNREALARMTEDACLFGTATARIRADLIDRMVNPPVIIYPDPVGAL